MKLGKNWQRHALEWSALAAIVLFIFIAKIFRDGVNPDIESYCPFGGLQAFINYTYHNSLPCGMSSMQIFAGIALAAVTVLFSKLFCAYLCPLGTVSDLLIKLRKVFNIRPFFISSNGIIDNLLRIVKYGHHNPYKKHDTS